MQRELAGMCARSGAIKSLQCFANSVVKPSCTRIAKRAVSDLLENWMCEVVRNSIRGVESLLEYALSAKLVEYRNQRILGHGRHSSQAIECDARPNHRC